MAKEKRQPKTDRSFMDLKTQCDVLRDLDNGVSRDSIMKTYGFKHKSNITRIAGRREKILAQVSNGMDVKKKLIRKPMFPAVEKELDAFVQKMNASEAPLRRDVIKEKAAQIASQLGISNFKASDGWITGFEKRNNIACVTIHGNAGQVTEMTIANWGDKLEVLLSDYKPDDVFNCDELGLFYRLLPDQTHAKKGSKCIRGKESKLRVTVLLGANMTGSEKLDPLLIGKSENPRCFKAFRKNNKRLPILYESNQKSWMTGKIFADYMTRINNKMRSEDRKILMLLDNCPAHPKDLSFSNIRIEFLPKNTTSVLQPMDQGIIRSFKCFYRKRLIQHIIMQVEATGTSASAVKIDVLQAMKWSLCAWESVTRATIADCFRKAGFKKPEDHLDSDTEEEDGEEETVIHSLFPDVDVNDYVSVDDDLIVAEEGEDAAQVMDCSESEEEEEEEPEPKPQKQDAIAAFQLLVRYNEYESFVSQSVIDKMQHSLLKHAIQTKVQTEITDFFNRIEN